MQIVGIQIKETMNENSGNYKDVKSFFFWVCKESSVALIAGNWYSKLFLGSDICLTSSFIGLRSLTWRRSPTPVSMQEEEEGSLLKPLPSTQKNLGREAALKRPDPSPSPLAIFLFSSSLPDFEEGMSHSEGESLVRGERKKILHLGSAGPCARSLLPRGE